MYEVYSHPPNFAAIGTYNNSHEYMMEEFWNDERFGGPIYEPLQVGNRTISNDMSIRLQRLWDQEAKDFGGEHVGGYFIIRNI